MLDKGSKVRMALDLLITTLEIRSQWSNTSRMKANSFKPKILYPTKLSLTVKLK